MLYIILNIFNYEIKHWNIYTVDTGTKSNSKPWPRAPLWVHPLRRLRITMASQQCNHFIKIYIHKYVADGMLQTYMLK